MSQQSEAAIASLPMTLDQSVPLVSIAIAATFVAIAAAVLLTPFGLVAELAAFEPETFLQIAQQPATAIQLCLALVIGLGFVVIPLRRLLGRARAPRRIVISASEVTASNQWLGEARGWKEPLTSYKGVAHHIRTTLSGALHEIVLIHEEPSKSVVLHIADHIGQPQVDAIAALLNVAEISPREMYRRTRADARPELILKAA